MQVNHSKLSKRMVVWYHYTTFAELMGPFVVVSFYSNHEGRHVMLKTNRGGGEVRDVLLADDDLYGELRFYDKPEITTK